MECKLADGDVTGAVRWLSSDASLAPCNLETHSALCNKHPPSPSDLNLPPAPEGTLEPLTLSREVIEKAFNPSSAAGPDRLRPQHLKELISHRSGEAGSRLLSALTSVTNLVLSGKVPPAVMPVMFGANLIALHKPDGGGRGKYLTPFSS